MTLQKIMKDLNSSKQVEKLWMYSIKAWVQTLQTGHYDLGWVLVLLRLLTLFEIPLWTYVTINRPKYGLRALITFGRDITRPYKTHRSDGREKAHRKVPLLVGNFTSEEPIRCNLWKFLFILQILDEKFLFSFFETFCNFPLWRLTFWNLLRSIALDATSRRLPFVFLHDLSLKSCDCFGDPFLWKWSPEGPFKRPVSNLWPLKSFCFLCFKTFDLPPTTSSRYETYMVQSPSKWPVEVYLAAAMLECVFL
jgi:hypothetical protein